MSQLDCPIQRACVALWSATLALMTAFMQTAAPAHRLLLARRIAANFAALTKQESFSPSTRASFDRLHRRWRTHADALALNERPDGGPGLLETLLRRDSQHL